MSPRPLGGVVCSRVPREPRVLSSVGEVPVAPPRVVGVADSCVLPDGVACGLRPPAVARGAGDPLPGGEAVPIGDLSGDAAPAGLVAAPARVPAPVAAPVVVLPVVVAAPVVVEVPPETPTPTAAPGLTP